MNYSVQNQSILNEYCDNLIFQHTLVRILKHYSTGVNIYMKTYGFVYI